MITFNEAKNLLNMGILPCLKTNKNNTIFYTYILGYDSRYFPPTCFFLGGNYCNYYLKADSVDSELEEIHGGGSY